MLSVVLILCHNLFITSRSVFVKVVSYFTIVLGVEFAKLLMSPRRLPSF